MDSGLPHHHIPDAGSRGNGKPWPPACSISRTEKHRRQAPPSETALYPPAPYSWAIPPVPTSWQKPLPTIAAALTGAQHLLPSHPTAQPHLPPSPPTQPLP